MVFVINTNLSWKIINRICSKLEMWNNYRHGLWEYANKKLNEIPNATFKRKDWWIF